MNQFSKKGPSTRCHRRCLFLSCHKWWENDYWVYLNFMFHREKQKLWYKIEGLPDGNVEVPYTRFVPLVSCHPSHGTPNNRCPGYLIEDTVFIPWLTDVSCGNFIGCFFDNQEYNRHKIEQLPTGSIVVLPPRNIHLCNSVWIIGIPGQSIIIEGEIKDFPMPRFSTPSNGRTIVNAYDMKNLRWKREPLTP